MSEMKNPKKSAEGFIKFLSEAGNDPSYIDKSVLAHAKLHAEQAGVTQQINAFDHFMKKALNSKESNVDIKQILEDHSNDPFAILKKLYEGLDTPNLFDSGTVLPVDEDEKDDELDEEIVEVSQVEAKLPELPAILFYDSKTHNKRRYYSNGLKGKPEWSESKDGAFVFQSHDHLRLASLYCRHYGYKGLDIETVI
jgi:hypothetical protein